MTAPDEAPALHGPARDLPSGWVEVPAVPRGMMRSFHRREDGLSVQVIDTPAPVRDQPGACVRQVSVVGPPYARSGLARPASDTQVREARHLFGTTEHWRDRNFPPSSVRHLFYFATAESAAAWKGPHDQHLAGPLSALLLAVRVGARLTGLLRELALAFRSEEELRDVFSMLREDPKTLEPILTCLIGAPEGALGPVVEPLRRQLRDAAPPTLTAAANAAWNGTEPFA